MARPTGTGKYGVPTKQVRVPLHFQDTDVATLAILRKSVRDWEEHLAQRSGPRVDLAKHLLADLTHTLKNPPGLQQGGLQD
jgi:hypothetical protein